MAVKAIPDGFHTVTPYLLVRDARKEIDFLKRAFDAQERGFNDMGGNHVHAEVKIGDSMVMIGRADPMPAAIYLYVPDVDALYKRAVAAGAPSTAEPTNQFYGDRIAGVKDPEGNTWWIGTHIEDVSADEIRKRAANR